MTSIHPKIRIRDAIERLVAVLEAPQPDAYPLLHSHLGRLLNSFIFKGDEVNLKTSFLALPPHIKCDVLTFFELLEVLGDKWPNDIVDFEHFHALID